MIKPRAITSGSKRGFALIISIMLMAFMLLLILSLSTLVVVETRTSATVQGKLLARQNALVGLNVALAQLQREAGPDERVTARATILGDPGSAALNQDKAFWTGVWNNQLPASSPVWMVSGLGTDIDPALPLPAGAVELVGGGTSDNTIRVPRVSMSDNLGREYGHYAYWVGDEGVKARVNLVNRHVTAPAGTLENRYQFFSAQRLGVERMTGFSDLGGIGDADFLTSAEGEELALRLERATDPRDIKLVEGSLEDGVVLRARYMDLSTRSQGVLADTLRGGLRKDLTRALSENSLSGRVFPGGPSWTPFEDFYQLAEDLDGLNPVISPRSSGNLYVGGANRHAAFSAASEDSEAWLERPQLTPIVVYAGMSYGLRLAPYDLENYRIDLALQPVVVMANPYNVAFEERDYHLRYLSFNSHRGPYLEMRRPALTGSGNLTVPFILADYLPSTGIPNSHSNYRLSLRTGFAPGEIKIFTINDNTGNPDSEGFIRTSEFLLEEGYRPDEWMHVRLPETDVFGLIKIDRSHRSFRLAQLASGQDAIRVYLDSETPAGAIGLVQYAPITVSGEFSALISPGPDLYDVSLLDTGLVLKGSTENLNRNNGISTSGFRTLLNSNVRSPYAGYLVDLQTGNPLSWGANQTPMHVFRIDGGANPILDPDNPWEPDARGNLVLFHLPREQLFSVGDFQHVDVSRTAYEPTYAVGNSFAMPWMASDETERSPVGGGASFTLYDLSWHLNRALWDQYYFSTWPRSSGGGTVDPTPANQRMLSRVDQASAAALDADELAGALMLEGAFNVNSTSVEAWKALLSSMNQQALRYRNSQSGAEVNTGPLANPYLRSPYPSGGNDDFWRGFRELSDDQIHALSGQIVYQVKRRGPFRSLSDFINRTPGPESNPDSLMGPLQAAIDNDTAVTVDGVLYPPTGINTHLSGLNVGPDSVSTFLYDAAAQGPREAGAPGYLMQADILRVLGPVLAARSDTFVIRSYGDVIDPLLGMATAKAWCEAVVQRYPEWLDETVNPLPHEAPQGVNLDLGRGFKLISFRWLTEDEI